MTTEARYTATPFAPGSEADEHGRSVARIAVRIAAAFGFNDADRAGLRLAARLHDIGKGSISRQIVEKPGPLSEAEWGQVRRHPELGAHLLVVAGLGEIASWVRSHHERPDGRGYPRQLSGDQIPLEARILAVADAYDAMVSDRPYRCKISDRQARAELRAGVGTQFDADVVAAFMRTGTSPTTGASAGAAPANLRQPRRHRRLARASVRAGFTSNGS